MLLNIIGRNLNAGDDLKNVIEKKFEKLDKYFSDDIEANVVLSQEKGRQKLLERGAILGKFQLDSHIAIAETIGVFQLFQHTSSSLFQRQRIIKNKTAYVHKRFFIYCAEIDALHLLNFLRV